MFDDKTTAKDLRGCFQELLTRTIEIRSSLISPGDAIRHLAEEVTTSQKSNSGMMSRIFQPNIVLLEPVAIT